MPIYIYIKINTIPILFFMINSNKYNILPSLLSALLRSGKQHKLNINEKKEPRIIIDIKYLKQMLMLSITIYKHIIMIWAKILTNLL